MFAKRFAKSLCAALVASSMLLAVLLMMAFNMGLFNPVEEEGKSHFRPDRYNRPMDFDLQEFMQNNGNIEEEIPPIIPPVNATILQVASSRDQNELYLKAKSYGDYKGVGFDEELEKYTYEYTFSDKGVQYSANYLQQFTTSPTDGNPAIVVQKVAAVPIIRVMPYYVRTSKDGEAVENMQMNDMMATGDTECETYTIRYNPDTTPTPQEQIPDSILTFENTYRQHVYETYLKVDDGTELGKETYAVMNSILQELDIEGKTRKEQISAIVKYVKNSNRYSLLYNTELDSEPNRAVAFLTDEKYTEGLCEHYAEAATLLLRAAGIPARYTEGIYLENIVKQTVNDVKLTDMHAWVEIYTDGIGWEYLEVTPPRTAETNKLVTVGGTSFSGNLFLKNMSFGDYDATEEAWSAATSYDKKIFDIFSADYIYGFLSYGEVSTLETLKLTPLASGKYFAPYYMSYDASTLESLISGTATSPDFIQTNDAVIGGDMSDYYMHFTSGIGNWLAMVPYREAVKDYERLYRTFVYENYLEASTGDDETDAALEALLAKIITESGISEIHTSTEYTTAKKQQLIIDAIQSYMNINATYTSINNPATFKEFLLQEDGFKGDSIQYATAVTLMLRKMGYPARYTQGVMGEVQAGQSKTFTVNDIYSWVEVYIDGFGWKCFDASPQKTVHINLVIAPNIYREQLNSTNDGIYEGDIPVNNFTATVRETKYKDRIKEYEIKNVVTAPVEEGGLKTVGMGESYIKEAEIYRKSDGVLVSEIRDGKVKNNFAGEELTLSSSKGSLQLYLGAFKYSSAYSQPFTKLFDGEPYQGYAKDIYLAEFAEDDILSKDESFSMDDYEVVFEETQASPSEGVKAAFFNVTIYDKNGEDCTDNFYILKEYGQILIQSVKLTIKAVDVIRTPDEGVLTAEEYKKYEYDEQALMPGHFISEVIFNDSRLEGYDFGFGDNIIRSVVISDRNNVIGTDEFGEPVYAVVTNSYSLAIHPGVIELAWPEEEEEEAPDASGEDPNAPAENPDDPGEDPNAPNEEI